MTVQKKILDLTGTQYLVQKITGEIPVKISDLQDDVSLGTHIADTDIHVTTADKNRWNNNTYVFRYSSTVLTASSTNSNTLLDNTDNLKVGDKVIDSSGVLFSITAIDTQNSTFTIGTALIDLAQDSDVVHKSGDESIAGVKTFSSTMRLTANPSIRIYLSDDEWNVQPATFKQSEIRFTDKNAVTISYFSFQHKASSTEPFRTCWRQQKMDGTTAYYSINFNNLGIFYPENNNAIDLGSSGNRWKSVYATNYYYGSNNVEFSTKFVTTDTNQTITGSKTFSSAVNVYNSDSSTDIASIILKNQKAERGESTSDPQIIYFTDKLTRSLATIRCQVGTSGQSLLIFRTDNIDSNNDNVYSGFSIISYKNGIKAISPYSNGNISLGTSNSKWSNVQTNNVNSLEPSSLSLPSDRSARIDISSYITNLGNGDNNQYTVPANGYIWLRFTSINSALCYSQTSGGLTNYAQTFARYQGDGQLYAFFPVRKSDTFIVQIYTSSTAVVESAFFIPCQGNV